VRLEPLRNFPLLGDLLVEVQQVALGIEDVGLPIIRRADQQDSHSLGGVPLEQYENCIECGLCVSACPIAGSDPRFIGPAVLAAGGRVVEERRAPEALAAMKQVGGEQGVWRCHGAFECSEVCPAEVDPAALILGLRGSLLRRLKVGDRK
jgi:succinate dehydrogenase / fumarate reductase iron-sulfur subunit